MSIAIPSADIVIPVRNRENTIARAVLSVLAQTHAALTLTVVDDGSTDGTRSVVEGIRDDRLTVVSSGSAGAGPSVARNAGARQGRAPFILFLDSDDEVDPEWLATLLHTGPDAGLVGCGAQVLTPGRPPRLRLPGATGVEFHQVPIIFLPGLFMVRRSLLEAVGGYDEALRFSENTELGFRLTDEIVESQWPVVAAPRALVTIHQAPDGRSQSYSPERVRVAAERILTRHGERLARRPELLASYHAIVAVNALRMGDPDVAARHLRTAVTLRPTAWRYWFRLAQARVSLLASAQ